MTHRQTDRAGAAVRDRLLTWFSKNRRELPWRKRRTPYRVWVAEIMLQQTRVDTVVEYYRRWMNTFPSWRALACAPQSDVLKQWEGLGYYSRARNLHQAAHLIAEKGGRVVSSASRRQGAASVLNELLGYPGIGPYTAAAIASLAFGEDAAVVDGNVIRVLSRLFAYDGDVKSAAGRKTMQAWADTLLVTGRAGEYNEAMMELGALICLPVAPKCADCPLQGACEAFAEGIPDQYPIMKKKKKIPHITVGAAITVNRKGQVLIAQRLQGDMLGGLWEFPGGKLEPGETITECIARELREELGINTEIGDFFMTVKHTYSHFKMTMHVYYATIRSARPRALHCADFRWVNLSELRTFAYSKADLQVVEKLQRNG